MRRLAKCFVLVATLASSAALADKPGDAGMLYAPPDPTDEVMIVIGVLGFSALAGALRPGTR